MGKGIAVLPEAIEPDDNAAKRVWLIRVRQVENGFVVRVHDSKTDVSDTHIADEINDAMDFATASIVTSRMQA